MSNQALTFDAFKATRRDMSARELAEAMECCVSDFGDNENAPVAVFHANCYAFVTGPGKLLVPIYSTEFEADDDAATWALYWDFYLPECHKPAQIGTAVLTDALREFCYRSNLPHKSADELLIAVACADMPDKAKENLLIEALGWFNRTWVEAEEAEHDTAASVPTEPGFYWGRWHTPAPGTVDNGDCCCGTEWEVHKVSEEDPTRAFVPGVPQTQPLDAFEWGPRVPDHKPG